MTTTHFVDGISAALTGASFAFFGAGAFLILPYIIGFHILVRAILAARHELGVDK